MPWNVCPATLRAFAPVLLMLTGTGTADTVGDLAYCKV